jgi:hypothetical protein
MIFVSGGGSNHNGRAVAGKRGSRMPRMHDAGCTTLYGG